MRARLQVVGVNKSLLAVIVIASIVVFGQTYQAFGQVASGSVIVAIPDVLPAGAAPGGPQDNIVAIILREPGKTDIIVLNPEFANEAGLASAVKGLQRNRTAIQNPDRGVMSVLRSAAPPRSRKEHAAMARALEKVKEQGRTQIGNLGPGRWYEFEADELML